MFDSYYIYRCIRENCPFAIAVLCSDEEKAFAAFSLAESVNWQPTTGCDPIGLDRELSELLHAVCPPRIRAAAAIAKLWSEGPASGGVIGDPHGNSGSADGYLEEIAPSIWNWAYPGVCGFIVNSSWRTACNAVDIVYSCISKAVDPWHEFRDFIHSNSDIASFLYASDASGKTGRLCAGNRVGIQEIEL